MSSNPRKNNALADALDLSNRFFQQSSKPNWKCSSNLLIDALCEDKNVSSSHRKRRSSITQNDLMREHVEPGTEFIIEDAEQQEQLTAFYKEVILQKNVLLSAATINNEYGYDELSSKNDMLTNTTDHEDRNNFTLEFYKTQSLYNTQSSNYLGLSSGHQNVSVDSHSRGFHTGSKSLASSKKCSFPGRLSACGPQIRSRRLRHGRFKNARSSSNPHHMKSKSCYASSTGQSEAWDNSNFLTSNPKHRSRRPSYTQSSIYYDYRRPRLTNATTSTVGSLEFNSRINTSTNLQLPMQALEIQTRPATSHWLPHTRTSLPNQTLDDMALLSNQYIYEPLFYELEGVLLDEKESMTTQIEPDISISQKEADKSISKDDDLSIPFDDSGLDRGQDGGTLDKTPFSTCTILEQVHKLDVVNEEIDQLFTYSERIHLLQNFSTDENFRDKLEISDMNDEKYVRLMAMIHEKQEDCQNYVLNEAPDEEVTSEVNESSSQYSTMASTDSPGNKESLRPSNSTPLPFRKAESVECKSCKSPPAKKNLFDNKNDLLMKLLPSYRKLKLRATTNKLQRCRSNPSLASSE